METASLDVRSKFRQLVSRLGGSQKAARAFNCTRAYVDMIADGHRRPGMRVAFSIERASDGQLRMQEWVAEAAAEHDA